MSATTEILFENEIRETAVEKTPYGDFEVRYMRRNVVRRWIGGKYDGKLELVVSFYRNGQYVSGYSDGDTTARGFLYAERAAA